MDAGGFNWSIMTIIGPILLLAVVIYAVLRNRSAGKSTSTPRTEDATENLYAEEESRRRAGTDDAEQK
ncbi:MAG: hypothetical protein ABIO29_04615 [Sphingomicrobium sp.]